VNIKWTELRELLRLAIPIILAFIGTMTMGLVDTLVASRDSALTVAGIGTGHAIFLTISMVATGAILGLDPFLARAVGSNDSPQQLKFLSQGIILTLFLSLVAVPCLILISYHFDSFGVKADVAEVAGDYLIPSALSLPVTLLFIVGQRFWQAQHHAGPIAIMMIVSNLINFIADWLLVSGSFGIPMFGAEGIGWATVITRIISLMMLLIWYDKPFRALFHCSFWRFSSWLVQDAEAFRSLLKKGGPVAIQNGLELGAFSLVSLLAGTMGVNEVAAHQIVFMIASLTFNLPLGLSSAVSVRIGYHCGRAQLQTARLIGVLGVGLSAGMMMLSALTFLLFPVYIAKLFTDNLGVIEIILLLFPVCAAFQIFDGIQVVLAGAFRGFGQTVIPMRANLIGHYFIGLPLGLLFSYHYNLGLQGLWIGLCFGLISTSMLLAITWKTTTKF